MKLTHDIFKIPIINNVILFESTDSTNIQAKYFGNNGACNGTLVIADRQYAGKGRMGRGFDSPSGIGLYSSLLVKPNIEIDKISEITILAALAAAKALDDISGIKTEIKWPNDVLINGKKAVGILTECSTDAIKIPKTYGLADKAYANIPEYESLLKYVIVGIGINVNNETFPEDISETATSIYLQSGIKQDRTVILKALWQYFSEYYEQFLITKNLDFIVNEYNQKLISLYNEVYIVPFDRTYTTTNPYTVSTEGLSSVKCLGINNIGNMICQNPSGEIFTVDSGEVSVRGLNSYSK